MNRKDWLKGKKKKFEETVVEDQSVDTHITSGTGGFTPRTEPSFAEFNEEAELDRAVRDMERTQRDMEILIRELELEERESYVNLTYDPFSKMICAFFIILMVAILSAYAESLGMMQPKLWFFTPSSILGGVLGVWLPDRARKKI